MEENIERELANERALAEILAESLSKKPFEQRMSRILEITTRPPVADLSPKGAIFLMDPEREALHLLVQTGLAEPLLQSCEWVPMGHCLCGRAAARREMVFADGIDGRHETHYEGMTEHGHYCVPIQHGDRLLGVFTLYVAHGHQRDPFEERFLLTVADILGNLIDRQQAYDALQQQAFYDELTGLPNRATEARSRLYSLIDEAAESHEPIFITGKRANAVLISEEDWRAISETLCLLSIPGMRESIKEGMAEPVEACEKDLDW